MSIKRKIVGAPYLHENRLISVRFMGPDYLCEVDDMELSGFFISVKAAIEAGKRHIDAEIQARQQKR